MTAAYLDATTPALLSRATVWVMIGVAYLLGSVPFGLILARWVKGVDLRTIGSGNIGATNAVRAMGRGWGFTVFGLDFLKGFVPVFLAPRLLEHSFAEGEFLAVLVGTASVLGHCYPIYLAFQGGKGVATGCGAIVAIEPLVFVAGGVVWLLTRLATGYAGLASILMGVAFPVAAWFLGWPERRALVVGAVLLMALILVRHRSNVQRMIDGTEPNARRKGPAPAARTDAREKETAGRHV